MKPLPILMLHSLDRSGSVISTDPEAFARAMGELAAAGWRATTLSEAMTARERGGEDRVVGLSFDDGYLNLRDEAAPVLRELGFSATVFVLVDRCGGDNRWPGQASWVPPASLLDWPDLELLRASGWEIASHGLDHRPLTMLSESECAHELETSRRRLEERLGQEVPLFAYPYGVHDATVRRLAGERYRAAFGVEPRPASGSDLRQGTDIPRIDAHYVRGWSLPTVLGTRRGRAYLTLRRWAGRLRGAPIDYAALGRAAGA